MANRDPLFDILKGIGIILVFVAHTFVKDVSPFIMSFHMPLFFIVSGYFFKPRPLAVQLRSDFRRIMVPFLLICVVTRLLIVLQQAHAGHTIAHPDSPAWFLLALFNAKFIYALICRAFPRHRLLASLTLSSIPCLVLLFADIPRDIVVLSSCLCAVVFIAVGDCVRRHSLLAFLDGRAGVSAAVALLLWLTTSIYGQVDLHLCLFKLWIIDFAGACAGTYLCYVVSRHVAARAMAAAACLSRLGYYSLVVYSFHAIEYVFPSWFQICSLLHCSALPAILATRFALCCGAAWAGMKIKPVRQIFFPVEKTL